MRNPKTNAATPRPNGWRRRVMLGALWLGIAAAAYLGGRFSRLPQATAEPPATMGKTTPAGFTAGKTTLPSDYSRRPVAYICNNTIPITREELGEYLIARYGKDKLKHLINKKIIEQAAEQKGIEVTPAEVEAAVAADIKGYGAGADQKTFETNVLKKFNKTMYEWKEDVVRPRLIMEKMCRSRVTVSGEDVAKAYEAYFGEKVDCKIIIWPKREKHQVMHQHWPRIRNSDEEFDRAARLQISPSLAAAGGRVKPIGRYTTGDEHLERVMFSLKPGEVSEVLETEEGIVVVKCIGRLPADATKSYEEARVTLEKEVFERKVSKEIGEVFTQLQKAAKPNNLLEPNSVIENVHHEVGATNPIEGKAGAIANIPMATPAPLPKKLTAPDGK